MNNEIMTFTKQVTAMTVMAACIIGCKEPSMNNAREKKDNIETPETDTMITINDAIEPVVVTSWKHFEHYDGKYITETDMLQREPLRSRLKTLLGNANNVLCQRFDVAPPIEVENDVLYNQGCRKHYCGADEAAIAIDMKRDVVYAGVAVNGVVKLYSETRDSGYPEKLIRWKEKFGN
ncbi:hypothetical protein [Chitinophaga sancti]|uniref:Lipoprotein n=2 Tax=Chitinophaga sancti TaxID=1004 RepID=A0ABZ0XFT7_9BACT|nr:hypothetical protein [Chitinophaga sancti]WQD64888.1 hypothetical protein U0033_10820 [Chitinophaga sancti]WQG89488.1 hypothetical protein SR876_31650 [Chitinophaga sancti]